MQHPGAPQRRALLVEDDPFAGQAFADFLNDLGYVTVLVSSYDDAIERFNEHQHAWALLVADIRLRRRSELRGLGPSLGIDLVRYVKLQAPQTPVLIWTAYTTLLSSIMPLLADGITGLVCLPKGSAAEQVQHAIHQAEAGAISIHYAPDDVSPQVAEQILQALPPATAVLVRRLAPQIAGLSRRERDVLEYLHLETDQIATQLNLAPKTVRNYLDNIYARLNLKTANLPLRRDTLLVLAYLVYRLR